MSRVHLKVSINGSNETIYNDISSTLTFNEQLSFHGLFAERIMPSLEWVDGSLAGAAVMLLEGGRDEIQVESLHDKVTEYTAIGISRITFHLKPYEPQSQPEDAVEADNSMDLDDDLFLVGEDGLPYVELRSKRSRPDDGDGDCGGGGGFRSGGSGGFEDEDDGSGCGSDDGSSRDSQSDHPGRVESA